MRTQIHNNLHEEIVTLEVSSSPEEVEEETTLCHCDSLKGVEHLLL